MVRGLANDINLYVVTKRLTRRHCGDGVSAELSPAVKTAAGVKAAKSAKGGKHITTVQLIVIDPPWGVIATEP